MTSIGRKIRDARKNAGMTQVELAKATNLSRSYIGDIEKDRYNPSVSTLQAIAKATNVPVETLLGGAASAPPAPQKSDGLPELNARDERDIERDLEDMLHSVAQADYKAPGDEEDTEALRAALRVAMIQAKRTAKKKYTPRKYRKDK
ncbi:helix-turn-helix domain-containing protein [Selenomonas bovis]|uniref:helix-turn-helix domain-containing protein n=1 Tax=Selenomonas bovis TaxID=416586 RepID=UPI003AB94AEF